MRVRFFYRPLSSVAAHHSSRTIILLLALLDNAWGAYLPHVPSSASNRGVAPSTSRATARPARYSADYQQHHDVVGTSRRDVV